MARDYALLGTYSVSDAKRVTSQFLGIPPYMGLSPLKMNYATEGYVRGCFNAGQPCLLQLVIAPPGLSKVAYFEQFPEDSPSNPSFAEAQRSILQMQTQLAKTIATPEVLALARSVGGQIIDNDEKNDNSAIRLKLYSAQQIKKIAQCPWIREITNDPLRSLEMELEAKKGSSRSDRSQTLTASILSPQ